MSEKEIGVILLTYNRFHLALKTIGSFLENIKTETYSFNYILCDDGSDEYYLDDIANLIHENQSESKISLFVSNRKGVGFNLNYAISVLRNSNCDMFFVLEDDWELVRKLDIDPYVNLIENDHSIGMIRFGYLSAGISATLESAHNILFWRLARNGYTYLYTGHPALHHWRLHEVIGPYRVGLTAGENELDYCSRYNSIPHAPSIIWPADQPAVGPFVHIGMVSLRDIRPGVQDA